MGKFIRASINGIDLHLFAQRAAYSPLHETLFVADTHFGKDATFRRHGVPVPTGSTERTMQTISAVLAETHASRLVILGDMFHARSSLTVGTVDAIEAFFDSHPSVRFTLIRGNHDAHVGALPKRWPIDVVAPGERLGRLALGHEPMAVPEGSDLLLCGHLHPAVQIGRRRESLPKLPCFWYSSGCLVFPAIGEFTGTQVVEPKDENRVWIIAEDEIFEHASSG
ncbi:ligase-associated DNA damage response endonuclease PdeM [Rhodopirellula bahusiensis]|uniref:Phosphoesterase n=1 Tax=Rhodopirellula bahusiensis TaxID=2014065 RepID=A0A2G1VZ93_9BACT|nr:ligase-associated DNA damage response endonuclease PdeM [Rhodopirellula bahusiensis]PHQ32116.1 phosphoesterase [Rhodopirellula bahusiensis]